jgi:hypothetical protein
MGEPELIPEVRKEVLHSAAMARLLFGETRFTQWFPLNVNGLPEADYANLAIAAREAVATGDLEWDRASDTIRITDLGLERVLAAKWIPEADVARLRQMNLVHRNTATVAEAHEVFRRQAAAGGEGPKGMSGPAKCSADIYADGLHARP